MRRYPCLAAGFIALVPTLAMPTASHAQSVSCVSPVTITSTSNFRGSGQGRVTVARFDFVGAVEHCLADGTRVPGTLTGDAVQVVGADGSGMIRVRETLTIPDGSTLGFLVRARFSSSSFEGSVLTTVGTGTLAGVRGRGTFFPTGPPTGPIGPTTFLSTIVYDY
jgi:hypothetical protein